MDYVVNDAIIYYFWITNFVSTKHMISKLFLL